MYPQHANEFMDTHGDGKTFRASNVNRCLSCGCQLMVRLPIWPKGIWECTNCKTKRDETAPKGVGEVERGLP